jgi:hypothetical protein
MGQSVPPEWASVILLPLELPTRPPGGSITGTVLSHLGMSYRCSADYGLRILKAANEPHGEMSIL